MPRLQIALVLAFATISAASVSLPDLQPIIGFSARCTNAYDTTVNTCDTADFRGVNGNPGSCSQECFLELAALVSVMQRACSGETALGNSLIGHFFSGDAPEFLCGSSGQAGSAASSTTADSSTSSTTLLTSASASSSSSPSLTTTSSTSTLPTSTTSSASSSRSSGSSRSTQTSHVATGGKAQQTLGLSGGGSPFDIAASKKSAAAAVLQSRLEDIIFPAILVSVVLSWG